MYAKDLKKAVLGNRVFFLNGDDFYWLDYAHKFFVELTEKKERDVNIKIFTRLDSLADIVYAITSFTFSQGNQLVIVKDKDYKATKDELLVLKQTIAQNIEPFILVFDNVRFLGAAEKKVMTEINCQKLKKYDLYPIVENLFKDFGGIDRQATNTLIDYTQCDMSKINLERQKLIAYAQGKKINAKMVESLVSEDSELQIYQFVNNLVEGHHDKALRILDKLLAKGENKNYVLGSLIRQYRRMLHSALSPKSDLELAKLLNVKEYAIKKSREIRTLNKLQMKKTLDMLVDYEYKFKSGQMSLDLAFDTVITKLIG